MIAEKKQGKGKEALLPGAGLPPPLRPLVTRTEEEQVMTELPLPATLSSIIETVMALPVTQHCQKMMGLALTFICQQLSRMKMAPQLRLLQTPACAFHRENSEILDLVKKVKELEFACLANYILSCQSCGLNTYRNQVRAFTVA